MRSNACTAPAKPPRAMLIKDLQSSFRQFLSVLLIAGNGAICRKTSSDCPHDYWDEPSKRCSDSLHQVLEEIRTSDKLVSAEAAELRHNKTCKEWDRTNACYQQLIQRCLGDETALHELHIHIGRYVIYSRQCQDPSFRDHKNMAECFLPDIKSTRTCTEAIDKYLRKFVVNKEYRSACRVISTAMKCFHDIKNNIRQRCRREGAEEYEQKYIVPLVDQTKETVLTQCSFTSPYKDYFLNSSPTTNSPPVTLAWLSAASTVTCAFWKLILTTSPPIMILRRGQLL